MSRSYELIHPKTHLRALSKYEIQQLKATDSHLHELLRRCCYAVLSAGHIAYAPLDEDLNYPDFDVVVEQKERGISLKLVCPPSTAFVDGEIIRGVREQLFSVLRDILYVEESVIRAHRFDLTQSDDITNAVFHILRNAGVFKLDQISNLIICWGGHSIPRHEYQYTKDVGYQLGLRGLDVATGCGPGAMKGPMKGAAIGHAKQHINTGRYVGITEPGIIAAESPNPLVNELVILPDIEKRLESFVRLAHGIIIFPGGPGTAEELLYLLGILSHPNNQDIPFPLVITGPEESRAYLEQLHQFIEITLGTEATQQYQLIINQPKEVARYMQKGVEDVRAHRKLKEDAFFFNWSLTINPTFQHPFDPTHEAMADLPLNFDQPVHERAANLRRAFSGIVAGNVKADGRQRVKQYGAYQLQGDPVIMQALGELLSAMVDHGRMKIAGKYEPCYVIRN